LQLRQPLLRNFWIDNNRLQIFIDRKNLQISELDLRNQVMTTVTAVEQAYDDLIYAQESIGVQRQALALAERLLAEDTKRVQVGALAPLSEKQDQAQVATSRADLLNALGTEETQQRVLKNLLSDNYDQWKNVAIRPTVRLVAMPQRFNLQESWDRGLSQRPDLIQQRVAEEKQVQVVRYQKNQIFPQLDVVGAYGYSASSTELGSSLHQFESQDNPFWSIGGQLSIPLGNRAAKNTYHAAKTSKEQLALQTRQLEQLIVIQIENAVAVAETDYERVAATREARIYAEAALDAEQKKLESGKSTSYTVLQMQRDLTTARGNEIQALANYNKALAQLSLLEASTFERHNISLQAK
jgi:HAE1 family hydrophobic/amphiphilic exporter-1